MLAALLLSACTRAPDDTLRFGLASAPVTLDPRFATDAASTRINRLLYARLVDFDDRLMPAPALADWQRLSPIHYRFHLSDTGREFHDGSRLTARDVKATYDFILDPANASPHRASLRLIERIGVIDGDTIDFHLSRADVLFPAYLAIGILPAQQMAAGRAFSRNPLGSGPFRFLAWPDDGHLQLLRLHDGQALTFVRVSDPTVRVLKLLRGEVDLLQNDLSPELVRYLQDKADISVQRARGSNFTYLGFNLDDPQLADPVIRRAIAQAIDREAIVHYLMDGSARLASALLAPDHWAGNADLPLIDHDPQAARATLREAGFSREHPLRLSYKTSTDPFRVRLATVLQSQLREVGIEVDLRSYDWGTFYGDIKAGNFQMYSLSWVGIKTPDIFRYAFHSNAVPPNGANRGRFRDARTDTLIEQAAAAPTLEKQAVLYRHLQARLLEQLPYVPLWYEDQVSATREGIEGYTLSLDGNYDGLISVRRE
ncbi:MAG: ABC transporter substrate-binding protein [Gammaproteobacteria bacterium]|nr:ABC transporter substrate-binding protein [Gammaproteobacteria bacterium]MCF6362984.1 ABC transporter substrate-binding protein [Gammaproteobacteria bacterium]